MGYASILERLRAGDMPPAKKPRPDAGDAAAVMKWIEAKLDSPLAGPPAWHAGKEKPIDGNRLPNAILFGGPRGPSVPPPPRLWRLSPTAYSTWAASAFNVHGLQQPFGLIPEPGFKDFAALYSPDEGATGLLLSNAEQIVAAQIRHHPLVNVNKDPEAAKQSHWPKEDRAKAATDQEREHLKGGVRVRGHGSFAPLLHLQVRANRDELERALQQQFKTSLARPPNQEEVESLIALYDDIARDGDCRLAGETILMAPLMAPEAILRFEVGLGAEVRSGVRMLSPRETAMALSLALSRKRDPGLLGAAAEGKLTTKEEVAEAVQRILDEPRIEKSGVVWFFREYFDYYRAPDVFKDPLPDYKTRRGVHYNPRGYVGDTDVLVMSILSRDRDVLKQLLTTTESYRYPRIVCPEPVRWTIFATRTARSFASSVPWRIDHRPRAAREAHRHPDAVELAGGLVHQFSQRHCPPRPLGPRASAGRARARPADRRGGDDSRRPAQDAAASGKWSRGPPSAGSAIRRWTSWACPSRMLTTTAICGNRKKYSTSKQ